MEGSIFLLHKGARPLTNRSFPSLTSLKTSPSRKSAPLKATPCSLALLLKDLTMAPNPSSRCDSPSLKIALALALLRYKNLHRTPSTDSDAQRWKRKVLFFPPPLPKRKEIRNPNPRSLQAKDRKREILRLREELKQLEGPLSFSSSLLEESMGLVDLFTCWLILGCFRWNAVRC